MEYQDGVSNPFMIEIMCGINKVHKEFGKTPIDNEFVQILIKLENYVLNQIEKHEKTK